MKYIKKNWKPAAKQYPYLKPLPEIAFFDIETTGFLPDASSLYLIGMLRFDEGKGEWELSQWFADDYHSEKEILASFLESLADISYLYHFNGKTFDIPYVVKKCRQLKVELPAQARTFFEDSTGELSIDLLQKIRPLRCALSLGKCSQKAVEQWLGIQREDTFSGGDLIPVYSEYMQQKILQKEKAKDLEQTLLLHNAEDVEMMLSVSSLLLYDEYLSQEQNRLLSPKNLASLSTRISQENGGKTLKLFLPLPYRLPRSVEISLTGKGAETPAAVLNLTEQEARLSVPLYEGSLKYFFEDYKAYYYLPKEDTAIHKSVATFVDKDFRQKATRATCYTKKEGLFLPDFAVPKKKGQEGKMPLFYKEYKDKHPYLFLNPEDLENPSFWQAYLPRALSCFRKGNGRPIRDR